MLLLGQNLSLGFALVCAASLSVVLADERIIDREPSDQLVLKGDARVFKLVPLDMAKREPVNGKDPEEVLVVRFADHPEQKYQVKWSAIDRVVLFEELVLQEASRLTADKQYEEAYQYFVFLQRRAPEFPGLSAARQDCLMSEARHWLDQKRTLQALVVLQELCEQNRDYPELRQAIGAAVDLLIEEYCAAGGDAAARELVDQLAARFADHDVVVTRRAQLIARAEAFLQAARVASTEQRWRESHDAIQMSLSIWPDLSASQHLAQELNARYPLVRVGVRDLDDRGGAAGWAPAWSTLRDRRLTVRSLFEAMAAMPGRVEHYSPQGTAARRPSWLDSSFSRLLESAEAGSDRRVPYRQVAVESGEKRFVAESHFLTARDQPPREIIECQIDSTVDALRALDQRRIQVFDRVAPWELAVARAHPQVELVRYAAPTVHMLIPNPRSPLMTSGLMRRAVSAAIDRERILTEVMGDGDSPAGEVLTGPFPRGYASDDTLDPPRHDPRLAIALLHSAFAAAGGTEPPRITFVYDRSEIARRAAVAIQDQLKMSGLGFQVALREATADANLWSDSTWELLLVEWPAMEPARDVWKLLAGAHGLGRADPEMEAALEQLAQADSREQASPPLRAIHRRVREQWTVIPLWQFHEHALVHRTLRGVGQRPVTLYQQVECWQVTGEP